MTVEAADTANPGDVIVGGLRLPDPRPPGSRPKTDFYRVRVWRGKDLEVELVGQAVAGGGKTPGARPGFQLPSQALVFTIPEVEVPGYAIVQRADK